MSHKHHPEKRQDYVKNMTFKISNLKILLNLVLAVFYIIYTIGTVKYCNVAIITNKIMELYSNICLNLDGVDLNVSI